ncbi:acid protease [Suillus decipiens]|nr:acid protease [Suillus decipiens]
MIKLAAALRNPNTRDYAGTSINTGQPVRVNHGSGFLAGSEYLDTVTLASGLTITKQSIGVASTSSGFTDSDGILRLGPVERIPTVADNLYRQGTIPQDLRPKESSPFGGTDATKYIGDIAYTPITITYPASNYWGINRSITYGSTTILSSTAGVVHTATAFILIATDAFTKYQSATGATLDEATGLLAVSSARYNALKNLDFHIVKEIYSLTPNAQIWPRSLNSQISGSSNVIYLVINDLGVVSGQGINFLNGYTFLLLCSNFRVGFAKTSFTDATTN